MLFVNLKRMTWAKEILGPISPSNLIKFLMRYNEDMRRNEEAATFAPAHFFLSEPEREKPHLSFFGQGLPAATDSTP